MGENANKKRVFVIDEHGRALAKESLHKLIAELFDNVFDAPSVDVTVANGSTLNICAYLVDQITGTDFAEWELIYLHGSQYPPILLADDDKEKLITLLPTFNGTSAEAICKVLAASGAFSEFH